MNLHADRAAGAVQAFGILEMLTAMREVRGIGKCREYVGVLRSNAGRPLPPNAKALDEFQEQRSIWATALANHCRLCGRCRLAAL